MKEWLEKTIGAVAENGGIDLATSKNKYPAWDNELIEAMEKAGIDLDLSYKRQEEINAGLYDNVKPIVAKDIPVIDGETVIQVSHGTVVTFQLDAAQKKINEFNLNIDLVKIGSYEKSSGTISFDYDQLDLLGKLLAPVVGFGFLTGGSASSYIDFSKNKSEYGKLFEILRPYFEAAAAVAKGKAKGITPAYVNPDASLGEDFMALKIRGLLIKALQYRELTGNESYDHLYQMFQMDSVTNSQQIANSLKAYAQSPILKDLIKETGIDIEKIYTASQPLFATFNPGDKPLSVFRTANGNLNEALGMPGGHGHNFYVLREIYKRMLAEGIRYVYLGNIDNMGSTVDDAALANLVLSGKQAAFDFSIKTVADVKGGIAVLDENGHLNCADIGVGISKDAVKNEEAQGKTILFNNATGLFDLKHLVSILDDVIENLPMRISTQKKDPGVYVQAEQVTWEILGMLDDPLINVVNKYERFLAAKMLVEGLMSSNLELDHPDYPEDLREIAIQLSQGMAAKLKNDYGMKLLDGRWVPKSINELNSEWKSSKAYKDYHAIKANVAVGFGSGNSSGQGQQNSQNQKKAKKSKD